ncbi:IS200/IS605 family transposase [bacterium]|nr:IS200/IS605 family transposase [bacterium]
MANTYTQIYIQIVFATSERVASVPERHTDRVYRYITGIVQESGHKLIAINGMPDHVHVLIGYNPSQSLSDLVRDVKCDSTKFINDNRLGIGRFAWQEGYGAFSYARSQLDAVAKYIMNQRDHHRVRSFRDEYVEMLRKFDVAFDDRYLFKWRDSCPAPDGAD